MTLTEIIQKIKDDPDFIWNARFENSLKKLLERYPEGAPTKTIAQSLLMTEKEVEETYKSIAKKLHDVIFQIKA